MFIPRAATEALERLANSFPAVLVTGPRQSGKTTLCRSLFPSHQYMNFEAPDTRTAARADPRGLLEGISGGVVLDEIQRLPELLSYVQEKIDSDQEPGRFVLTGSANFALLEAAGQTLAGRVGLLTLPPIALSELGRIEELPRLEELMFRGFYPRLFSSKIEPMDFYGAYTTTYVERDIRQIVNVGDLERFQAFLRLCAGRTAQVLNLSDLARDAGISHGTARTWLSLLEAGYIVYRLSFHSGNYSKRIVKAPKIHFWDVGLAAYLIGVTDPSQLETHPLRGSLFESMVVAEIAKQHLNRGRQPRLSYYRDSTGLEVDVIVETGTETIPVEIKATRTLPQPESLALTRFMRQNPAMKPGVLIYAGGQTATLSGIRISGYGRLAEQFVQ